MSLINLISLVILTSTPSFATDSPAQKKNAAEDMNVQLREYRARHALLSSSKEVASTDSASSSEALDREGSREYFDRLEDHPHPETDKKWELLNTRYGKGTQNYLRNLHHALYTSFVPWFDRPGRRMSYEQMMRSFHVNTVRGADGTPYYGVSPSEHGWTQPTETYAGIFRHDVRLDAAGSRLNDRDHTWHIRVDVKFPSAEEGLSSRFKLLQQAYVADPAQDKVYEPPVGSEEARDHNGAPSYFLQADNKEKHYSLDAIRMPGTELPIPVHNQIYQHTVLHKYPSHEMKPYLVEAMAKTMTEIQNLAQEKKEDPATLNKVVELVSRYIYLGAHSHLFESVNMSIVVAQANYALSRFNLEGIRSGTLDFRGMYEQYPEFYDFVRRQLTANNPRLQGFQAELPRSPLISILAHVQNHGDIYFPEGQIIKHPTEESMRIEGLMVTSALPDNVQLQYMGHIQGTPDAAGGDTPWTNARTFVGTAGQSRALEGIAFRLVNHSGSRHLPYSIHYRAQIAGSGWTKECSDEEFCGTRGQSKPITALQVWIVEKPTATHPNGEMTSAQEASISDRRDKSAPDGFLGIPAAPVRADSHSAAATAR